MAYKSAAFPIQLFPEYFKSLMEENGWEQFFHYDIIGTKLTGKTNKRARVYLYKSVGSDLVNRYFGFVHPYGGDTENPAGTEYVITRNSVLGEMVQDLSDPLKYHFKVSPIVSATMLKVYIDGTEVLASTYDATNADAEGYIVFNSDPNSDDIKATYAVSNEAPTLPDHLYFFTFEEIVMDSAELAAGTREEVSYPALDVASGVSVIEAVYNTCRFINPSLPTTISFIDNYTNAWSRDSDVTYWANITRDRIIMFFRVEPTPDPLEAHYVPLYLGRITTLDKEPRLNNVVIGGSILTDAVASSAAITVGGKELDYGTNVTNGLDGIQLQQSIGGSLYQKHYLSFITHDPMADPSPEARYNPSAYTDKYHISPMYIVHPNDGFVGMLDEVYAVHPKNIAQQDELVVKESSTNELLGVGDGKRKIFHLRHTPKKDSLHIKVNCVEKTTGTDYTIIETKGNGATDEQLKVVTFTTAPSEGEEVYADYSYEQTYVFILPTTPETPFRKADVSPYAPIGLGILKLNEIIV